LVELFPSAARFAAHLAFIAAESCARRSGERFSFFFGFFAGGRLGVARAVDLLTALDDFAASASCSLRFNFASFGALSRRRFSSCRIFFFNFFTFIIVLLFSPTANVTIGFSVNDKIPLMSCSFFALMATENFMA
jgi:hypothetical protein